MCDFHYATETFEAPTVFSGTTPLTTARRNLDMAASSINRTTWVYKITNTVNGKLYFGITVKSPPQKRWLEHIRDAYRTKYPRYRAALQGAIRKYGPAAFAFEVIYEAADVGVACAMEKGKIAGAGSMWPLGYNLTSGGDSWGGQIFSPASRAKISAAKMGKKSLTPEGRERIRQYRLGRKWSAESKAKASASKKGKKWTAAQRERVGASLLTAEYRAKMRRVKLGKPTGYKMTEERKKQISMEQTVRMVSVEVRRALSEKAKTQFKNPVFYEKYLSGRRRHAELKGA